MTANSRASDDDLRECGICGDYTAGGIEVHAVCLERRPMSIDPVRFVAIGLLCLFVAWYLMKEPDSE